MLCLCPFSLVLFRLCRSWPAWPKSVLQNINMFNISPHSLDRGSAVWTKEQGCPVIACLESSHHSTVIETESLDLYASYFGEKDWLFLGGGLENKMVPEWMDRIYPKCIINRLAEFLCILWNSMRNNKVLSWLGRMYGWPPSYSKPCLHDTLTFCGNQVERLGVTQEFSFCKRHFLWWIFFGVFLSILHQQTLTQRSPLCGTFS